MTTKKLLAAYDPSHPATKGSDFLAVVVDAGQPALFGLRSGKTYDLGLMVYVGREITEKDLFAKLVEAGRQIPSVDDALLVLEEYLRLLQDYRVGNIVSVRVAPEAKNGFQLTKVAEMPRIARERLP